MKKTKREGAAPPAYRFELTGGALCLDFANTVDRRPGRAPEDHVQGWDDLVAWAEQSALLSKGEAVRLRGQDRPAPSEAARILEKARTLREALFGIFSAVAAGRAAPGDALAILNGALPEALARLSLAPSGRAFAWRWADKGPAAGRILTPVIDSAAELLTSPDLTRVRECQSDTCAWLFLDTSRNRTRRWCDMTVCGNRAKARRHYERARNDLPRNRRPGQAV